MWKINRLIFSYKTVKARTGINREQFQEHEGDFTKYFPDIDVFLSIQSG